MKRWLFLPIVLILTLDVAAQKPAVDKIEPPNWWSGMQWSEVQIMVYGEHLGGITATFDDARLRVESIHTLPNTSYAFVDVTIPDDLPAGEYELTIENSEGVASIAFPILERASASGKYQGFGVEDVVYLITPDRFANANPDNDRVEGIRDEYDRSKPGMRHGGDLEGIIRRMGYLQDLGITAIWLNPVLENRGRNSYHGYAATDLYRVDPRLGTNADLKRLVEVGHEHGIKFIFDHVSNHIGIEHAWMNNLPMDDWINGTVDDHLSAKHYKMAPTDPHADPYSDELLKTFWFVDAMPDMNQRNPYLANYLIQNTLWWIEYTGMDGIREDTYPYPDQAFMAEWAEAIMAEYPNFNIVGEIWELEPAYLSLFQKESRLPRTFETNLPAIMDFPLMDAFREYLLGSGTLDAVYKVIAQDFVYTDTDNLMTFIDNHDVSRGIFIAEGDMQKMKQILGMLLTMRGIPQLLYGTEINMKGGASHIELRADFPGGFPGDERDAFTAEGRTAEENEVFDYIRSLLHLRKDRPVLTKGRMIHYPKPRYNLDIYKYLRLLDDEVVVVLVNGTDERQEVDVSEMIHWFDGRVRLKSLIDGHETTIPEGHLLPLEARGLQVYDVIP